MKSFRQFLFEIKAEVSKSVKNFNHSAYWAFEQPTIRQLKELGHSFHANELPKTDSVYPVLKALQDWVQGRWIADGGMQDKTFSLSNRENMINYLLPIATLKSRAKWTTWSGVCWRGVSKPVSVIKKSYEFTGEWKQIGREGPFSDDIWAKAKTAYKSHMPLQSWTTNQEKAIYFSTQGEWTEMDVGGKQWLPVVFEHQLLSSECVLAPHIIPKIFPYSDAYDAEAEVLRVSRKATTVTAWVNLSRLFDDYYRSTRSAEKEATYSSNESIANKVGMSKEAQTKFFSKKVVSELTRLRW